MDEVSIMVNCPSPACERTYAIDRHNTVKRESGYPVFDCFEIACDPVACPGFFYLFYIDLSPDVMRKLGPIVELVYDEIPLDRVINGFRHYHADIQVPAPRYLAADDHRALRTFRRAMNGSDGRLTRFLTS